ncbi:MAG: hypothetical protein Q7R77_02445 [Candidatus Daviesbacteria bacterium]|nr:hypothetical protein [Candidatus Daviesbacteria bacterium]
MKLKEKLSGKHFILANCIILFTGLALLGGLYYILNIQYQQPKTLFSRGPVTTQPRSLRLELEQPEDDSLVFTDSLIISGKTLPSKEVLIYTDDTNLIVNSKPDGSFTGEIDLAPFENKITVVVFNATGKSKSQERTVYYSKEKI